MIQIKPITLGLPAKQGNHIMVRPIINSTQSLDCNTYYEVVSKITTTTPSGVEGQPDTESSTHEVLASGNYPITAEQYAAWGNNNDFIENIVIAALGLEREII